MTSSQLNLNNRPQGTQVAPPQRDFGSQVQDPNILGFDHKTSQAGNAFANHLQRNDSAEPLLRGSLDLQGTVLTVQKSVDGPSIELSKLPSITYTFLTPPDSTMDSGVYVRPKGRESHWGSRLFSRFGGDCEGLFEFGESADCWERQADASTNTRPIGYRELELFPKLDSTVGHTQVVPGQLEKAAATLRGIILNPQNILWGTNGDFTISKAEKQIEEFISRCWKVCSKWYYHIQFLHAKEGCYRNKYFFEVKWSLPSKESPIPIAKASVFFSFDVELYSGRDEPVKVHYVLEGTRFPHTPGLIPFQQKWLSGIICEKMRLIRDFKF
ncbi:unnamed protein product [Allacma fusca]|uniref:Uncharacterized protein n=1 Tax=Allacma fusca TaxID=39272 RepID=A0A8J2KV48_9HEXA|nr:unnamed protein product [Allacma fusca]